MTESLNKDMKNLTLQQASGDLELNSRRDTGVVLEGTGMIEDLIFEDFTTITGIIVCTHEKNQEYDSDDEIDEESRIYNNSLICAPEIHQKFISKVGVGKKVRILSLANTFMDDKAFKEVSDHLLPEVSFVDKFGILDLSFNTLTDKCAEDIIRWIDKGATFINIFGNAYCSKKYVEKLCYHLKTLKNDDMSEVQRAMSHIVFLPNYYINIAEKKVKLYNELCAQGYLPNDWVTIHRSYYLSLSEKLIDDPDCVLLED